MNKVIDIAIVGAGASGLMLGALLQNKNVTIFDGYSKVAAKVLISGGGKCNITNDWVESIHYLGNPYFVDEVLRQFDQHDLLKWLSDRGLVPITRGDKKYFCANSSSEIVDILKRENRENTLLLNHKVIDVIKEGKHYLIQTEDTSHVAKHVVIASGGLSFSILGADDVGFRVAKSFGHEIIRTSPALVGFTVQKDQFFFKTLSGMSTDVEIKVGKHSCLGRLLFTHKGISGPAVLDASLYWDRGQIEIDFFPGWFPQDYERSQKNITTLLPMPKRVSRTFLEEYNIPDVPLGQLKVSDKERLYQFKSYSFAPAGTFGYGKAEVTKGGVDTDEIDSKSMMSKNHKNLYFIGEVQDVTGRLGGYNLQWAFSTAFVAATALQKS